MTLPDDTAIYGTRDDIDAYVDHQHSLCQYYEGASALAAWEHRQAGMLTGYFAWLNAQRARQNRSKALRFMAGLAAVYFAIRLAVWAWLIVAGVPHG
jgi:hypothetical protein